ncbi:MAG TPA: 3-mercaptopyruvate sulfurtransferase [Kiloniellales bacterium]
MTVFNSDALVGTEWLAEHLTAPDIRVVDGSYYLPHEGLDARAEYEAHHIPGAVFFDIDDIADTSVALPHMIPPPEKFSARVRKLGLGDGVRIIAYDQRGLFSAPRVWWTFRLFGHRDVAVLDGGLVKWLAEGRPIEEGPAHPNERHFTARTNSLMVRDRTQVLANLESAREQLVDARSRGRFEAREPEPRPGLRSGHIPGSRNLPFTELVDRETQTLLPPVQLRERFTAAGIDMKRPVITSCGSGITAAVVALALHIAGHKDVSVYDGSWAEWGDPASELPVATGPAD